MPGVGLWSAGAYVAGLSHLLLGLLGGCATPVGRSPTAYENPVFDADFPDPTIIRAPDGIIMAMRPRLSETDGGSTSSSPAPPDLVHWQHLGDALPAKPRWAATTQDFWAPHVVRDGSRYILYYSAKPDTADERHGLCLAVATSTSPAGPFVDMGHPLQCGKEFINIDPMAYDDRATGKRLLFWGSGFQPIKVQELAPGPHGVRARQRTAQSGLAQSGQERLSGAGRRCVGVSPRRLLLPLLLGR